MDHRIEILSTLLVSNEPQSNVTNISKIAIEHEHAINGTSVNACSSIIKVEPLLVPASKRLEINSSIRKHTSETSNTKFSNPTKLKILQRKLLKRKRVTCDQCKKTFSQRQYLSKHKKVHTGEKPYQCDVCQKKFSDSSNLTRHKRIHTGEKPYECDLCPKKFPQASHLLRHKKTHT
jgi:KRAB domain-containing zinc finger protein